MTKTFMMELRKVHTGVGQGSLLEQLDKRYRKQQRLTLFEMLEQIDCKVPGEFPGGALSSHPATREEMAGPIALLLATVGKS
jgi:hypothetical protein